MFSFKSYLHHIYTEHLQNVPTFCDQKVPQTLSLSWKRHFPNTSKLKQARTVEKPKMIFMIFSSTVGPVESRVGLYNTVWRFSAHLNTSILHFAPVATCKRATSVSQSVTCEASRLEKTNPVCTFSSLFQCFWRGDFCFFCRPELQLLRNDFMILALVAKSVAAALMPWTSTICSIWKKNHSDTLLHVVGSSCRTTRWSDANLQQSNQVNPGVAAASKGLDLLVIPDLWKAELSKHWIK